MTRPSPFTTFVGATIVGAVLAACTATTPPTASPSASGSASPSGSASASASASATASARASGTASAGPTVIITLPPPPSENPQPTPTPTSEPTITPTPTPAVATIVRFRREHYPEDTRNLVDCTHDDFDGFIHLAWRVRNATGATLSIDGPGIYKSYDGTTGEDDVPFACGEPQHTYTLTTIGGIGEESATRTIRVAEPQIIEGEVALIGGGTCSQPSDSFPVFLDYGIANATGIELRVDGELYTSYSGKSGDDLAAGDYSCANASQEYELTTTGGFGEPDTFTLTFADQP